MEYEELNHEMEALETALMRPCLVRPSSPIITHIWTGGINWDRHIWTKWHTCTQGNGLIIVYSRHTTSPSCGCSLQIFFNRFCKGCDEKKWKKLESIKACDAETSWYFARADALDVIRGFLFFGILKTIIAFLSKPATWKLWNELKESNLTLLHHLRHREPQFVAEKIKLFEGMPPLPSRENWIFALRNDLQQASLLLPCGVSWSSIFKPTYYEGRSKST